MTTQRSPAWLKGPLRVNLLNIAFASIGALVFILGLISTPLKNKLSLSEPLLALVFGILIGPVVFDVLRLPSTLDQRAFVEEVARITLALSIMAAALRVPYGYFLRRWSVVLILVGIGMLIMWGISSLILDLVLGLPLWIAALIGGMITPTDPVIAGTLTTGDLAEEHIPGRLRHLLTVESGINDGLAFPFVSLSVLMLTQPPKAALTQWVLHTILWEVCGGIVLGAAIGFVAGKFLAWSQARVTIEHISFLGASLALSLLTLGALNLVGVNDLLGVFSAGVIFNIVVRGHNLERQEHVQSAVSRFFDLPIFVLIGLALPWQQWLQMGWRALVLIVLILLFRRIPALLLLTPLLKPVVRGAHESLLVGWFGPIGISALFYISLALGHVSDDRIWSVTTLLIVASIVTHGLTATPFTLLFGRAHQRAHHKPQEQREDQQEGSLEQHEEGQEPQPG
jgi:NhaP-type Na+/H+ or K+/H+ antiporter